MYSEMSNTTTKHLYKEVMEERVGGEISVEKNFAGS